MTENPEKKFLNCIDCLFFDPEENGRGLCRRNSPTNGISVFPMVLYTDWCGDLVDKNSSSAADDDAWLNEGHDLRPGSATISGDIMTKQEFHDLVDGWIKGFVPENEFESTVQREMKQCLKVISLLTGW